MLVSPNKGTAAMLVSQPILRELNSIIMQIFSFVFVEKLACWSREWKACLLITWVKTKNWLEIFWTNRHKFTPLGEIKKFKTAKKNARTHIEPVLFAWRDACDHYGYRITTWNRDEIPASQSAENFVINWHRKQRHKKKTWEISKNNKNSMRSPLSVLLCRTQKYHGVFSQWLHTNNRSSFPHDVSKPRCARVISPCPSTRNKKSP